jgi:prefoldin beta subunit
MSEMDKETKEKIANMQVIDQKLQASIMQKQNLQAQLLENENALAELKKDVKEAFRILGNIMIKADPKELMKEVESNIETLNVRIKNIEKQEIRLRNELTELQNEIMKKMKK